MPRLLNTASIFAELLTKFHYYGYRLRMHGHAQSRLGTRQTFICSRKKCRHQEAQFICLPAISVSFTDTSVIKEKHTHTNDRQAILNSAQSAHHKMTICPKAVWRVPPCTISWMCKCVFLVRSNAFRPCATARHQAQIIVHFFNAVIVALVLSRIPWNSD